jgi:hypothetical protein
MSKPWANSNYKGIPAKSTKPLHAGFVETRLSSVQTIQPTHTKPAIDRQNKVRTAKLQPVLTAASDAADPDEAGGIDTVQGKYVLGEIDAEKDNGAHGHLLASTGSGLESRNPMVDPGRSRCMRGNLRRRGGGLGDGPFIR